MESENRFFYKYNVIQHIKQLLLQIIA